MAELVELNPTVLEKLRCSFCKRFLSCSPIQVLPDGSSVCGRCFRWEDEVKCRNFALEAVMKTILFPCEYKKYGCKERVVFDNTNEHESKCAYRAFMCPVLPGGSCPWLGSAIQIYEHFTKQHANLIKDKLEFKLQNSCDDQGILIVKCDDVVVTMKYLYKAGVGKLQYDLKYIALNMREVQWKVRLTNDSDGDYTISTKGDKCLPFNIRFYDKQDSKILPLTNFVQNLNNPIGIIVTMDLNIAKSDVTNRVDLDKKLLTLRCKACMCYLIPPIFDCKKGTVCAKCHLKYNNAKPTNNEKLKELADKTIFPCRWRSCNYSRKGSAFGNHDLMCPFRIYECVDTNKCKDTFMRDESIAHLEGHGFEYFKNVFVYKVVFDKTSGPKTIFTFKNHEVVCIERETHYDTSAGEYRHYLMLKVCDSDTTDIVVNVQVAHQHCKIESNRTVIWSKLGSKRWHINVSEFPECFRLDEELTFTLKL